MARKTKEEAQKTRQLILDTALSLFCANGITETSLTDIASMAGVTRGAIYWHFKNKNELFLTIWEEFCEPLSNLLDASISTDEPDPLGKLHSFLTALLHDMATNPGQQQMFVVLFNLDSSNKDIGEIHQHTQYKFQKFLSELELSIANAIHRGQIPYATDAKIVANLISATINGCILNMINNQLDTPSIHNEQNGEAIVNMLFNLLSTHTPAASRTA